MTHSYVSSLHHCVFSTKERHPFLLNENVRAELLLYLSGIATGNRITPYTFNGVCDHVHLLIGNPATLSLSKSMQLLKTNSSKWIHERFPEMKSFTWQEGYGAFSIGVAQVPATIRYIENQEAHHRKVSFQEEYKAFVVKHGFKWHPDEALG